MKNRKKWSVLILTMVFLTVSLFPGSINVLKTEAIANEVTGTKIAVTGQGIINVNPDQARLRVGVITEGTTAKATQEANNRAMNRVLNEITRLGIAEENIKTVQYNLWPQYNTPREQTEQPKIVGYRANHDLDIIIKDLGKVGPVIDTVVAKGSNKLNGISFEVADDSSFKAEALQKAVAGARKKADAIAVALGNKVVRVINVEEQGVTVYPIYREELLAGKGSADSSISPGQVQITASVNMLVEAK